MDYYFAQPFALHFSVADWRRAQEFVDDLDVLTDSADFTVAKLAQQLNSLILTQGTVLKETDSLKEKTQKISEETEKIKAKAQELKSVQKEAENLRTDEKKEMIKKKAEELKQAKETRREKQAARSKTLTTFEAAILDAKDPLVPVRGHGLIELARLVEQNDQQTVQNMTEVLNQFMEGLSDQDTYIYLSAINGLVTCARYVGIL